MDGQTLALVAAAVVGGLALLVLAPALLLRAMRRRGEARLAAAGMEAELSTVAQSLGVASAGRAQVRGNGHLALGPDRLLFAQWVPRREVSIPLAAIRSVDTTRSHLGKTIGSRLLRVTWERPDGAEDTIALHVRDLQTWLDALERGRPGA
jgi:hypothetical protein